MNEAPEALERDLRRLLDTCGAARCQVCDAAERSLSALAELRTATAAIERVRAVALTASGMNTAIYSGDVLAALGPEGKAP